MIDRKLLTFKFWILKVDQKKDSPLEAIYKSIYIFINFIRQVYYQTIDNFIFLINSENQEEHDLIMRRYNAIKESKDKQSWNP